MLFNPKYVLSGNTLVFTDVHFGYRVSSSWFPNSLSVFHKTLCDIFDKMLKSIKENEVKQVIFLGDFFEERDKCDTKILNDAHRYVVEMSHYADIFMIIGNHDEYHKFGIKDNSCLQFSFANKKVHIIDEPTDILLNNKKCLLVPWFQDKNDFIAERPLDYDMLFGHFDLPYDFTSSEGKGRYEKLYIKRHKETSTSKAKMVDIQSMLDTDSILGDIVVKPNVSSKREDGDIGDFFNHVKDGGYVYCGHEHHHKEFEFDNKRFMIVGCPYQQNASNIGEKTAYYILNGNNNPNKIEITDAPIIVELYQSKVFEVGIDNYDFEYIRNNIVYIYSDISITVEDKLKLNDKIGEYFVKAIRDIHSGGITINTNTNKTKEEQIKLNDYVSKDNMEIIHDYIFNDMTDDQFFVDSTSSDEILSKIQNSREEIYQHIKRLYDKEIENLTKEIV